MRTIVKTVAKSKIKHGTIYFLLQNDGQKIIRDKDEYLKEGKNDLISIV